jgi:hypothetical protein
VKTTPQQRFQRDVRRVVNQYLNGAITRAVCLARIRQAAITAGINQGVRPSRADKVLDVLAYGGGDIEPGLLPKHLAPLTDAHHRGTITDAEHADQVQDLLRRLRAREG